MLHIGKLSWLIKFTILVTIITCYSETFAEPFQWVKVPFTQLLPTGQPDSLEHSTPHLCSIVNYVYQYTKA